MAGKYSIEAIFKILDGVSGPMSKMSASTSKFSLGFERDVKKAEMKWRQMGQTIKTVGKVAIGAGIAAVGAGLASSTKKYIDFEDSITKAGSKFKDLDVTSEDYAEKLELLQGAARKVGATTKYSATDAAGALDKYAMSGMTSEQAMGMLMGTTNLATAAGTDLTSAVDMATDALGAFGFSSIANGIADTEEQTAFLSDSLDRISDVVAKTTNMANTDMNMWFESVKMGGATFTSMGGTLEEFSGMVGILANAGIKGGEAGTALRNIMLNLGAPSSTAAKALGELGIQTYDAEGKMLPIIDILEQFEESLAGVDEQTKNAALENIFGKRGVGSFLTLMDAGTDEINKFVDALEHSQGTAEAIARAQEKSLKGQLASLTSALEDKQLSFGKAIADNGGSAGLATLITMVQNWDPTPVINVMIAVMDKLPAIINFVMNLVSTLWSFRDVIAVGMSAFLAYKAVVMAVGLQQAILNAIVMANPFGLLVAAIAGAIAIGVLLKNHWDEIIAVLEKVVDVVINGVVFVFNSLLNIMHLVAEAVFSVAEHFGILLGPMGMILSIMSSLVHNFGLIKTAFSDGGILAGIKQIGFAILNGIVTPIQHALELLSKIPGVGKAFGFGADKLSELQSYLTTDTYSEPVAPVTQGDRVAYSSNETWNNIDMNIRPEKGWTASVSGSAPGINIHTTPSAAY